MKSIEKNSYILYNNIKNWFKTRKDIIYEIKTHFGADRCCYPNRPLRLFHHLRPDGQSTGRKSAAGIAVLYDRYTGSIIWVCGGAAVFSEEKVTFKKRTTVYFYLLIPAEM